MSIYYVLRRNDARQNGKSGSVYMIAAVSEEQAKKTACRLDKLDEQYSDRYIAISVENIKNRPAATDRLAAKTSNAVVMKTIKVYHRLLKNARGEGVKHGQKIQ